MDVVRIGDAPPYEAPGHFGFRMVRLQGHEASPAVMLWMGLSVIAPGGHTTLSASPAEKLYVVLEGEVSVSNGVEDVVLRVMDSCRIAPNEPRELRNAGPREARILLAMPLPQPAPEGA